MDLLEFARGPALSVGIAVFVFGTLWRVVGLLLLRSQWIRSKRREGVGSDFSGAVEAIIGRMWPHRTFARQVLFSTLNGYTFHIGLAIVVFGFAPHILFIKGMTGLSWGALPNNLIFAVGVITAGSLVAALVHRLMDPPKRLISGFNDYFTWFVTIAPVVTGLLASTHLGARYETLLAVHLLSVALLLIWFPFGKLIHAVLFPFSRGATGVRMKHRGAQI